MAGYMHTAVACMLCMLGRSTHLGAEGLVGRSARSGGCATIELVHRAVLSVVGHILVDVLHTTTLLSEA